MIDPLPYSEAEDAAVAAGLASLSVDGSGRTLTLGLVAVNSVDRQETIQFLDPQKEPFLEYDVIRLIESVGRTARPKVGLLTSLPMEGSFDPRTQRPTPPWQVLEQMRELYDVTMIRPEEGALPEGLDVLVIAHPKHLAEPMLRAIDAHALRGGRIVAFLDPLCEAEQATQPPGQFGGMDRTSDLGGLPRAWGIEWTRDEVVGDRTFAQRVQARGRGGAAQVMDYVIWLGLSGDALNHDAPVTGALSRVNLAAVGAIAKVADATSTVTTLMQSSADSMMIPTARVATIPDPAGLLASFRESGRREALAVQITGAIGSAFPASAAGAPGTDPAAPPSDTGSSGAGASPAAPASPAPATTPSDAAPRATAPAAIIVVADADLLADELWFSEDRLGPVSLGWRTIADNGAFVLNAIELLSGDSALLSLRGRGQASRPFERVESIRRAAEAQYLSREQQLQDEIRDVQEKIAALQREKSPENRLILSPEQEQEVKRLEEQVVAARKELRQVQFNLRSSVESLGTRLMFVNVVAWPLVVALAAVGWSLRRAARTRAGGRP
ncbi:MAG: Gldg family protein [Phycisphaerales bacterium]